MTLQQLINVVETYRCGSISRAAEKLFMAQPNLSTSIRTLEEELGIQIFKRTSRGIECTDSGKDFLNGCHGRPGWQPWQKHPGRYHR